MAKLNSPMLVGNIFSILLVFMTAIRPAALFFLLLFSSLETAALLAVLSSLLALFSYVVQFEAHRNSVIARKIKCDWVTGVILRWIFMAPIFFGTAMWLEANWHTAFLLSIGLVVDAIVNVEQKLISFFSKSDKNKVKFLTSRSLFFVFGTLIGLQFGSALEAFAIGILLQIFTSKSAWSAFGSDTQLKGAFFPVENVSLFVQGVGSRLLIFGERVVCSAIFTPEIVVLMAFSQSAIGFLGSAFEMKTNSKLVEMCNEEVTRFDDWTIKSTILRNSFKSSFQALWQYMSLWVIGSSIIFTLAVLLRNDIPQTHFNIAVLIFLISATTMIIGHIFAQSCFLSGQDFTIGLFYLGYLIALSVVWYFGSGITAMLLSKVFLFIFTLVGFFGGVTLRPLRIPYPRKLR